MRIAIVLIFVVVSFLGNTSALAQSSTHHVSLTGSDTSGEGTKDKPWRSIQFAINSADDGLPEMPTIIQVGPGEFAETSDGNHGRLHISNRKFIHIIGSSPSTGPSGTRITTKGYLKSNQFGILRVDDSTGIELHNLVIGDDRNWSQVNAFFQSTVDVEGVSDVRLHRVHIVGPTEATLLSEGNTRSPTAVRAGYESLKNADQSVLRLDHVLVTGHGSFLSNPIGKVFCRNLTVAQTYGLGHDDHFGFLQTPRLYVDDRRYTFERCIFYELKGNLNGQRVGLALAEGGVDNVYFDGSPGASTQNLLVRAVYDPSGPVYYSDADLASPSLISRSAENPSQTAAHGVFAADETSSQLTGNLVTRNGLVLRSYNGFEFASPPGIDSGWVTIPSEESSIITVEDSSGAMFMSGSGRIDFGSVGISGSSSLELTIRNTGKADLSDISVNVTGAALNDYQPQPLQATTLAPGASTPLVIVYSPSAPGIRTATLQISSNAGNENPFLVSLTGTAIVPPSITAHPLSQTINSGASVTLSVTAGGTAPLTYQWYRGASGVTTTPVGTNSPTYTTPALTSTTSYWVKVSNSANPSGANSNAAVVSVRGPMAIYWDGNLSNANSASNNSATSPMDWLNGGNWDDGSASIPRSVWMSGDTAVFGGTTTGQSITLTSPVNVGGITFQRAGYVLTGSTLNLVGTSPTIQTDQNASISSSLAGSAGLAKTGSGTLLLSGINTFSGGATLSAGRLQIGNGGTTGTAGSGAIVLSGGTLVLNRSDSPTFTNPITAASQGVRHVEVASGTEATLSGVVTGYGEFWKSGGGTLKLGNTSNNFSTSIVIKDGILQVDALAAIGGSGNIFIGEGGSGTFRYSGSGAESTAKFATWALQGTGANSVIEVARPSASLTITSGIGNTGTGKGLTKSGPGTLLFSGANTYDGMTVVNGGILAVDGWQHRNRLAANNRVTVNNPGAVFEIRGSNALPVYPNSVDVNVNPGAKLRVVSGNSQATSGATTGVNHAHIRNLNLNGGTVELTYSGTGSNWYGESFALGGSLNVTGSTPSKISLQVGIAQEHQGISLGDSGSGVTMNVADVTADDLPDFTVECEIEDPSNNISNLTKAGAGTMVLSGTNTYTGITRINGGVLSVGTIGNGGAAGNLGAASNASSNVALTGGALRYTGTSSSTNRGITLNSNPGNGIAVSSPGVSLSATGTLTGGGGFTKSGAGRLLLYGTNTYTGPTQITDGILSVGTIGNGGANGNLGRASSESSNIILNGGTLSYRGTTASTNRGMTFENAAANGIEVALTSTTLSVSGALVGPGGFVKHGAGTLALSGSNTYSGTTEVREGVIQLGKSSALGSGTGLILSGGTFNLNGHSQTMESLMVSALGAVMDFGGTAGANTLRFTNGATAGWTGSLVIRNFDPRTDALYCGNSAAGVADNLDRIRLQDPVGYPAGAYAVLARADGSLAVALSNEGDFLFATVGGAAVVTGYSGEGGVVTLPASLGGMPVRWIGSGAFKNQAGMTGLVLPAGLTHILEEAFAGCTGLASVIVPASVTHLGNRAFNGCASLRAAGFQGNAPTMGSAVFDGSAVDFSVYFLREKTGFTSPLWNEYPSVEVDDPSIILAPSASGTVPYGGSLNLSVAALSASALTYQWYQGETGDVFSPLADGMGTHMTTPALTATTRYWVRVATEHGFVDSKTVVVGVQVPPEANANLAGLVPQAGELTPAFDPAVITYQLRLPHEMESVSVTPTLAAAGATAKVNGTVVADGTSSSPLPLVVGNNTVTIIVTAADGTAFKTYTVTVSRAAAVAVATGAAEVLGPDAAWLAGAITPNGNVTGYFEYGPSPSYGSRTEIVEYAGDASIAMKSRLEGLAGASTYHYRAVGVGPAGPVYGADRTFETSAEPPLAATGQAASTGETTATLTGAVNPRGLQTKVSFEYGLTNAYGRRTPEQTLPAGMEISDVNMPIIGLIANTTYHCRIVAMSGAGTSYGDDVTFFVRAGGSGPSGPSSVPTVATGTAAGIGTDKVLLLGEVTANGGATLAFFEYGPTAAYGSRTATQNASGGTTAVSLSIPVMSLLPGTNYHYRLVASNSLGTERGEDRSFTTLSPPPAVVTGPAEILTTTRARLTGTVRARGADAAIWFDYGTDGISFPSSVRAVPATVTGDEITAVSAELSGLAQGTTYHYRVRAVGTGGTAVGTVESLAMKVLSGLIQKYPDEISDTDRQGAVSVTLTPPGIASGWRLAGEQTWRASDSTAAGLVPGDRVIEYRPVPGMVQPLSESVSIARNGPPLSLARTYVPATEPATGRLTVYLKPRNLAEAVEATERLQWRLAGDAEAPWLDSGATLEALAPGNHLVECREIPGRVAPELVTAVVANGNTTAITITYQRPPALVGAPPETLDFATVAGRQDRPYAYVGQLRNEKGSGSGFVVRPGVVATAGHVVFDDGTLTLAGGLEWLFQRDRGSHEPQPVRPRGIYLLSGYAAQRALDNSPGMASAESQALDAASVYFTGDDPGRGGYSGYLASDNIENEFVLSLSQKILVGYPVSGVPSSARDRMAATAPAPAAFTRGLGHSYATSDLRGFGGCSGGPLCVRYENGNYYPAAIYLGGSALAVVRAIDGEVADLIAFAESSAITGQLGASGAVTLSVTSPQPSTDGSLQVVIEPTEARAAGAGWRLRAQAPYQASGAREGALAPNTYTVDFSTVAGFVTPSRPQVAITAGRLTTVTFNYEKRIVPPVLTSSDAVSGPRGQPLSYQITALNEPDAYQLLGILPDGMRFEAANGRITGTPTVAGNFVVTVGASNRSGSASRTLAIASLPLIGAQTHASPVNRPFSYRLTSSESGDGLTYMVDSLPSGLSLNPRTGEITGTPTVAGTFHLSASVTIRNATATASLTLHITDRGPVVISHPTDHTVAYGGTALLSVLADGSPAPTYQWYEGTSGDISRPVAGAASSTLRVGALVADTRFWARASNSSGYADSTAAMVTVLRSTNPNLTDILPDSGTLTPAFSPELAAYGLVVPYGVSSLTLTVQAEAPQTTVEIQGIPVALGAASTSIPLAEGDTTVQILATAGDGVTRRAHTLQVTRAPVASVTTGDATEVTDRSATLNGGVTPHGPVVASFEYGPTRSYGQSTAPAELNGGVPVAMQAALSGLLGSTTYHYRLVVSTPYGTFFGEDREFSTSPDQPAVATGEAVGVGTADARLVGAVATNGLAGSAYFEIGKTTAYGTQTQPQAIPASSEVHDIFQQVLGLEEGATYHYRIVVTTATGTVVGEDVSFVAVIGGGGTGTGAPIAPPSATTSAAIDVTTHSALLQAVVNPRFGATLVRFEYGTTTAFGSSTETKGVPNSDQPVNVTLPVHGLEPGQTYYFRVIARSSSGTATGLDATFTTGSLPPKVTTGTAQPISSASAKVTGSVRPQGTAVDVFFDYGTDGTTFPFSVAAQPATVSGIEEVHVQAVLGNLDARTTYHYRIRAVGPTGETSGTVNSLRTDALVGTIQAPPTELAATERRGQLTVSLVPGDLSGTGWRLLGETAWRESGSTVAGLATGERDIEFRPLAGYVQPESETVSVTSGGAPVVIERFYYRTAQVGTNAIRVHLLPAVATQSAWRLSGEPDGAWRSTGTLLEGVMDGTHLIEFRPVEGWLTPIPIAITVVGGETRERSVTYQAPTSPMLNPPKPLEFNTITNSSQIPYRMVGQVRGPVGAYSGFAVKKRVVLTAAQSIFDETTLAFVPDVQWLPQRDRTQHEPEPMNPHGSFLFGGYAAQRATESTPDTLGIASLNLNVAALFFSMDAARGGYTGFLASDSKTNPYLTGQEWKVLAGYPSAGVAAQQIGRMHATNKSQNAFDLAYGLTFTSMGMDAIRGLPGMAGGPLCVMSGSTYLPAGVYVGGTDRGTVRAFDAELVDLLTRAEISSFGGENQVGGGITFTGFTDSARRSELGTLEILIEPEEARLAGARWGLDPESPSRQSGFVLSGLAAKSYLLKMRPVQGFQTPTEETVMVLSGKATRAIYRYVKDVAPPALAGPTGATALRGYPLVYQIEATGAPTRFTLEGALPAGVAFNPATGLISGTAESAGVFPVTVGAINEGGATTRSITLVARPSLPDQRVTTPLGQPLFYQIQCSESGPDVSFSAIGLPPGLTLDAATGSITGTPILAGEAICSITATTRGATTAALLTLNVTPSPLQTWRLAQFGTTENTGPAADSADPDGDGQNNLAEYTANTGPKNPQDFFRILSSRKVADTFLLTADGKAGRTYVLERITSPTGTWTQAATTGPLVVDETITLTDPGPPAGSAIYRIRVTLP